MCRVFAILILMTLCAAATPVNAQRDSIAPLVGGTYQTYYDLPESNHLMSFLTLKNVCPERFFDLNPEITPQTPMVYGTLVILPREESCYSPDILVSPATRLKYYENAQWLEKPYYSANATYITPYWGWDNISYYEVSKHLNICMDDLLKENILWQRYTLKQLLELPDQWHAYSLDTFLPTDPSPCYAESDDATREIEFLTTNDSPMFFVEEYNICPEALVGIPKFDWTVSSNNRSFKMTIPENLPPCYNEQGQRLRYFDDAGIWLETPSYSDLEVYYAMPYATLPDIAQEKGVCLVDLLRVNGFPELPVDTVIELFIPPRNNCDPRLTAHNIADLSIPNGNRTSPDNIAQIVFALNVCMEDFLSLNPQLNSKFWWYLRSDKRLYDRKNFWVIGHESAESCYNSIYPYYYVTEGSTLYDLERRINVCHEAFIAPHLNNRGSYNSSELVWYLKNTKPCYDDAGRRLKYQSPPNYYSYVPEADRDLTYSNMRLHTFQSGETVYSISHQYNVCVNDILKENFPLTEARPTGYPVFIPDVRPCYDEMTGLPLIYEDDFGNPLSQPQVAHDVRFYGWQPLGRISYYYNVCESQIDAANPIKPRNHERGSIGWVIPTNRPPCYHPDGSAIEYACYHQNGADTACFEDYDATKSVLHTFAAGESLVNIARFYDIPTWRLAQANQLDSSQAVWVGQTVVVPLDLSQSQIYRLIIAALAGLVLILGGVLVFVLRRKTKSIAS